jgi:uncharacterized membrane protein YagU involved in acid resistance
VIARLVRGAGAGLAATLAMSAWMLVAQRAGWLSQQPPERITHESIRRATGARPSGGTLDLLTSIVHAVIGMGMGSFFAVVAPRRLAAPVLSGLGAAYGLAIWIANYGHVLPELGLMPRPTDDERRRPQAMIVAHLIFGSVLGATVSVLRSRAD